LKEMRYEDVTGEQMPKLAYDLIHPQTRTTSVVFASPHSGRDYPWSFIRKSILDERLLRSSEDAFVDRLFDKAPSLGAPFLMAGVPRAFIDLNRAPDELDPALIEDIPRSVYNPRIASGLGVVPRVVAGGRAIYRGKLTLDEARNRISTYWRPYHDILRLLIEQSRNQFGEAILIDCHSMPHEALENIGSVGRLRPDVVLGDRFGAAASSQVVDRIEAAFAAAGLRVARNMPFAGAYITQTYGRPSKNCHAIQIEIDRALYMDERAIRPNGNFEAFRALIQGVMSEIVEIGQAKVKLAAE
jgi:N-formylglutamate deformylase